MPKAAKDYLVPGRTSNANSGENRRRKADEDSDWNARSKKKAKTSSRADSAPRSASKSTSSASSSLSKAASTSASASASIGAEPRSDAISASGSIALPKQLPTPAVSAFGASSSSVLSSIPIHVVGKLGKLRTDRSKARDDVQAQIGAWMGATLARRSVDGGCRLQKVEVCMEPKSAGRVTESWSPDYLFTLYPLVGSPKIWYSDFLLFFFGSMSKAQRAVSHES